MTSKKNSQLDLSQITSDFYRGIDPNVIKDNDYLKRIQQNCVEQTNPFTCYFTLLLGEKPKITWRHNTARHFGIVDLSYEDVFTLVHPAWLNAYISYAGAMYEVTYNNPEINLQEGGAAGSLVPLRHRSGKYYWYHQISVRVANDGEKLAAHLNYYHQSTAYEGQLPSMPTLSTLGEVNPKLTRELNQLALEFLPGFLKDFLTESQVEFMLCYRKIIASRTDKKAGQRELLAQMDGVKTVDNLNKIKQRIRQNVVSRFQHPSLDSAYELGIWLNRYFPLMTE